MSDSEKFPLGVRLLPTMRVKREGVGECVITAADFDSKTDVSLEPAKAPAAPPPQEEQERVEQPRTRRLRREPQAEDKVPEEG